MNAVIKAITPGIYLRNVFETTDNLTLDRLTKFPQSHFVERNTLDLSQHSKMLTQSQKESASQCIYRAMTLKQKLVLASKSPAAEASHDKHVAQKLLLKTVETGLSSESIFPEIKLLLRITSYEDMIFAVVQSSSTEFKRLSKISKAKGSIKNRVNMLNLTRSVSEVCDEKLLTKPSSNKAGGDEALTELLKSIQKQLNNLQGQVKEMKLDNKTSRQNFLSDGRRFRSNKCQDCLANNFACVHCFLLCRGEEVIAHRREMAGDRGTKAFVSRQPRDASLFIL